MKVGGSIALACLALGLGGCLVYGGKPEKLHNPEKKKAPPDVETAIEVKYIDDCQTNFQDDPKKWHPNPAAAHAAIDTADTALASSDKSTDPNVKVGFLKDAIEKYRSALIKDPYNAEATLKLAVTYDRLLRKGCALALLKRLASLSNYPAGPKAPPYAAAAKRAIDSVGDNAEWFKGYRKDATSAVGL